jgi:hypothetical protein
MLILPTFAILMETSNLRLAHVERLRAALASIAAQEPSPAEAEEVVLLEDGSLPGELLADVSRRHPWLRLQRVDTGLTYGDQKSISTAKPRADVVVVADPDCVYEPGWLRALLEAFASDPAVGAVAGETTIAIRGPFTLAAALFFFFPRFSGETALAPARGFYLNNVAFRRDVVEREPIPLGLPVRGGQNVLYSRLLDSAGVPIARHPGARAFHAPPEDLWMAMRIHFWTGRDTVRFDRLAPPRDPFSGDYEPYGPPRGRVGKILLRLRDIARQQPIMLLWLPVAAPIAGAVFAAFFAGRAVERWTRARSC